MSFLSDADRVTLKKLHREIREKRLADRIKCILSLDAGYTYEQIKEILLIDESTISEYKKKYIQSGIDQLLELHYQGYEGKLTDEQEEDVKAFVRNNLITSAAMVVEYIKNKFGIEYTPEGMVYTLHRLGFEYIKTSGVPSKSDIDKQKEFIDRYNNLKAEMCEGDKIYFMDQVHPQHNSESCYAWVEKGKRKMIPTNSGRKRVNINGALDIQTKEVIVREDSTINAESDIKLFKQIEEKNPEAKNIYVIVDNVKHCKSKRVKEYLKTSRIKLEYIPPYSPNLNLIERVWRFMRKKVTKGRYYERFEDFKKALLGFFDNIRRFKGELENLLTENFQIVGVTDTS